MATSRKFSRPPANGWPAVATERWAVTGLALLLAYAVLVVGGWRWELLSALQDVESYKQLTGLTLALFFFAQWRLTVARMDGGARAVNRQLLAHRTLGMLAPLLLYLHADEFGHAYVRVMCWVFVGLVTLGLVHPALSRINRQWLTTAWLVTHVALAAGLAWLIGYHAFNAFYYE